MHDKELSGHRNSLMVSLNEHCCVDQKSESIVWLAPVQQWKILIYTGDVKQLSVLSVV